MFAYCNNNPPGNFDATGEVPSNVLNPNLMMYGSSDANYSTVIISPLGDHPCMHTLDSGKYADSRITDDVFLFEMSTGTFNSEDFTLMSFDFTALAYRLYTRYFDLFLLDFVSAEAALSDLYLPQSCSYLQWCRYITHP